MLLREKEIVGYEVTDEADAKWRTAVRVSVHVCVCVCVRTKSATSGIQSYPSHAHTHAMAPQGVFG